MSTPFAMTPPSDLWPITLSGLDALIREHHRALAVYPDALVMTPAAFQQWRMLVVSLGGRFPGTETMPTYMGIPIIVSGTPDDVALVGVIGRKTLHGEPIRVACFASEGTT